MSQGESPWAVTHFGSILAEATLEARVRLQAKSIVTAF